VIHLRIADDALKGNTKSAAFLLKAGAQNDWSVCTTWLVHEDKYYLLDLTRGRYE
jgi:phage terminase large subunit-like protein